MSLINQMLQDLDARGSEAGGAGAYGEHIRAVAPARSVHPAWWLALLLAIALIAVLAWAWLRPAAAPPRTLPLRLDTGLDLPLPTPAAPVKPIESVEPVPAAPEVRQVAAQPTAPLAVSSVAPVGPEAKAAATEPAALRQLPRDRPREEPPERQAAAASNQMPGDETRPSKPAAAIPASPRMPARPAPMEIHKQPTPLTPSQQADNMYRDALLALQQGRTSESVSGLRHALELNPGHIGAREALIGIYLDQKKNAEAARLAHDGLTLDVRQAGLAMVLARLQLEQGALHPALATLEKSLPYAEDDAAYQAFLAALLQRDQRPKEAVEHYLQALRIAPRNSVWWMGLGISLQADNRRAEAVEAFKRAKSTGELSAELLAFVDDRLQALRQ